MLVDIVITVICFGISCFLVLRESPQIFVRLLVAQSFFVAVYIGLISRIWYAYTLFLVFLGGILVIFVYIRSLSVNIKLENIYNDFKKVFYCVVIVFCVRCVRKSLIFISVPDRELTSDNSVIYILISISRGRLYLFVVCYLLFTLYCVC